MNNLKETWKNIVGYENFYQISDYGQVKRLTGYCCKKERILKPKIDKGGYLYIILCKENKSKTFKIHRLVLETFVGLCPPGMECRHLDGNSKNNKFENLKWGTSKENKQDTIKHNGSYRHCVKLNNWQIRIIKRLLEDGYLTQREIAKIFEVHFATISCIKLNKTWKEI